MNRPYSDGPTYVTADGRLFVRVGLVPYQRKRDGRIVPLIVWRGQCRTCGTPFEVATSLHGRRGAFELVNCPTHRLRPGAPRGATRARA
jgi:hypothetical protein